MKVLIVGLGAIAKKHIEALRNIDPGVEIFALRSNNPSAIWVGITNIYEPDSRIRDCDFAIISNPTGMHADAIEQLLDYHIPLFIEKPLFDTLEHADTLQRLEHACIPTYVGCNLRFLDSIRFLQRYIAENPQRRVNEVNVYCGSNLARWGGDKYRSLYNADPKRGGGVHIDMIHDVDYVCHIFGMPQHSRHVFRNVSSLGIDAYDYANYILEYPGFTANIILNYYRPTPKRILEIVFADEVWTADLRKNVITDDSGKEVYRGNNNVDATYTEQMQYFIDAIQTGQPIRNNASTAYRILSLCLNPDN